MAFFARLIPTAIQGAGWLIRNSGSFSNAFNAIRNVFSSKKLVVAQDSTVEEALLVEIAGFGGFFPALSKGLKLAEGVLGELVGSVFTLAEDDEFVDTLDVGKEAINLAALWPNPDTSPGKSVPAISGDINKHLTANEIPSTFTKDGKQVNLGDHIAREIFSLPVKAPLPGQKPARKKLANIDLGDHGRLRAAVAAYPIPLGNKGYDGWHSYLRIYHDKYIGRPEDKSARLATLPRDKSFAYEDKPYNMTTIQATFNGVVGAEDFIKEVIKKLPKPDYRVPFDVATAGNVITFQVETAIDIGPGQVQSTVASAAGTVNEGSAALPTLPDFEVTNNQVLLPVSKS